MKKLVDRGFDQKFAILIEQRLMNYWKKTSIDGKLYQNVDLKI